MNRYKDMIIITIHTAIIVTTFILPSICEGQTNEHTYGDSGSQTSADSIINRANEVAYYQGKDFKARVHMIIKNMAGQAKEREFTLLRINENPNLAVRSGIFSKSDLSQKYFVYFNRPGDVKNCAFLVWKKPNGLDDRWLYLPAFDKIKKVVTTDKRKSFIGSDYYYEDISGRCIDKDDHQYVKTENGCYVIKNVPRQSSDVEFSFYLMWISINNYATMKIEYYNKANILYRVYESLQTAQVQGFNTTTHSRMKNIDSGSETIIEFLNISYNQDIRSNIFREPSLKNPPLEYLK